VGGDLAAEDVGGALSASSVGGDATLRQLHGPLSLGDVGGDVGGRNWSVGAEVAQVGGDASLKSTFAGPQAYRIQARGDVVIKAFPGSDATFTLKAPAGRVWAKGLAGEATDDGWRGALGGGEAQVVLSSSHGSVRLKAVDEPDEEQAAFVFETEFGTAAATAGLAAEELAQRIQRRVAEKLSRIDFEAIARREAEREADRARRLAEKACRRAERARRRAERRRWRVEWGAGVGRHTRQATAQGEPVSEEERLAVLKMLAEGKISADEADVLLQALES
jgi:hypothetical protein